MAFSLTAAVWTPNFLYKHLKPLEASSFEKERKINLEIQRTYRTKQKATNLKFLAKLRSLHLRKMFLLYLACHYIIKVVI